MFFKSIFKPNIIEEYDVEVLQEYLNKNGVYLQIVDNSTLWAAFAQKYGREHGLRDHVATSFSYMVSVFLTGMGVSAGTEMYFKEEEIEFRILDEFNEMEASSEEEKARKIFQFIFDLYKNEIGKYEKKTKRLDFVISQSEYEDFMEIPGDSKVDKLRNLLNNYE